VATAGAIRGPTDSREMMEMPEVALRYTTHMFSMQAKCSLGIRTKHAGCTGLPQQSLRVIRTVAVATSRLFFLYAPREHHDA
jgi:hypothetical protein